MLRRSITPFGATLFSAPFKFPTPPFAFSRRFTTSSMSKLSEAKKISTSEIKEEKIEAAGTHDTVVLPIEDLDSGYKILHRRLNDMVAQAAIAAYASPVLSGIWLLATEQMLLDSSVAIATLATGGIFITERMMQIKRVNQYAQLSTITNPVGPSTSEVSNQRIRQIIAGDHPTVTFNSIGLKVSGSIGDIKNPSPVVQNTLSQIHAMNRVALPTCTLTEITEDIVNLTSSRWGARLTVPIAILNIIAFSNKDPKDRNVDDYFMLASSSYNIYDYLSGPSVAEAREKFTNLLITCTTPQEVIRVLIDNKILDKGAMSFLNEWVKNQSAIGIRVGLTGTPILYKNRITSFGGPYPLQLFPQQKVQANISASETIEDTSPSLKKK